HSMSHYEADPRDPTAPSEKKDWMEIFTYWNLDMYADLLAKLDAHMDADGISTVLDNTVAVYGGDNSDSAEHGCTSQACIMGGRGGATAAGWRIRSGRHLRFGKAMPAQNGFQVYYDFETGRTKPPWPGERSWKDLLWGMLNIVGVPDPSDGK